MANSLTVFTINKVILLANNWKSCFIKGIFDFTNGKIYVIDCSGMEQLRAQAEGTDRRRSVSGSGLKADS